MARYLAKVHLGLRAYLATSLLVFVGLVATACSASGSSGGPDGYGSSAPTQAPAVAAATAAPPAAQDVQATLTEFTITLSAPTLKAGHVRFNVSNTGKFPHALEITGQGTDVKTPNLTPGQTATLEADLPAGRYEVWCPVDGHKGRGMDTSIMVQ